MESIAEEILKAIKYALEKQTVSCDKTFASVVKQVTAKGYIILDETGCERVVRCCIPNTALTAGQRVWVKIPTGELNKIHICGVIA